MKSGHGSCRMNRTRCGSTTTTSFTFALSWAPLGALEAEHDVLGGEWVAVVEFKSLAQRELEFPLVLVLRPGFREARRHADAGHRLHQRVVQPVQEPKWRDVVRAGLTR